MVQLFLINSEKENNYLRVKFLPFWQRIDDQIFNTTNLQTEEFKIFTCLINQQNTNKMLKSLSFARNKTSITTKKNQKPNDNSNGGKPYIVYKNKLSQYKA